MVAGGEARERGAGERREASLAELRDAFRSVFRALTRLRGRDTHLAAGELSYAQLELLVELQERGELSVGELAAAARLAPATVTQMLENLSASGHVERVRSHSDRRVVVTRLTAAGAGRIEAKRSAWRERWEQTLEEIPAEELRAAARVLERIRAMLEEPVSGEPGRPARTTAQAPSQRAGGRKRSAIVG